MKQLKLYVSVIMIIGLISGCDLQKNSNPLDDQLYSAAEHAGADNLERDTTKDTKKVELGRMLFFDKLLSGNKDISCATCHHPTLNTGDALSLSIGVRSEEHRLNSSHVSSSYAVFCLKIKLQR